MEPELSHNNISLENKGNVLEFSRDTGTLGWVYLYHLYLYLYLYVYLWISTYLSMYVYGYIIYTYIQRKRDFKELAHTIVESWQAPNLQGRQSSLETQRIAVQSEGI